LFLLVLLLLRHLTFASTRNVYLLDSTPIDERSGLCVARICPQFFTFGDKSGDGGKGHAERGGPHLLPKYSGPNTNGSHHSGAGVINGTANNNNNNNDNISSSSKDIPRRGGTGFVPAVSEQQQQQQHRMLFTPSMEHITVASATTGVAHPAVAHRAGLLSGSVHGNNGGGGIYTPPARSPLAAVAATTGGFAVGGGSGSGSGSGGSSAMGTHVPTLGGSSGAVLIPTHMNGPSLAMPSAMTLSTRGPTMSSDGVGTPGGGSGMRTSAERDAHRRWQH
jgi:hypothetical protein